MNDLLKTKPLGYIPELFARQYEVNALVNKRAQKSSPARSCCLAVAAMQRMTN